ncbi:hypothetical protein BKG77_01655 [Mycobacteroides chelonae]|uniref:DUF998 domain-containing protein n=1 Tax=Mycobacteroides chelonae TaxID=1774 RepID=A0A1S1LZS1_MYCCH|nr:hypothetical protein [Mycobacteroides chelonae]OHU28272.1 hypothetical protein BKG77_01655 [Mycobacteroides chelonae]OHU63681.1 hypothetical protein BKG85_09260 [Mycobacteroides chelonae]OHU76430.1 hypothetical protein BKG84_24345 [Mycobacteroides chelonae]QQG88313.1 hypothetical protein HBA99_14675 [Mycobacteroides chelonae]QQG93130.1 hypothetical protein HBA97_14675 [Mycobacteroides chelonae]
MTLETYRYLRAGMVVMIVMLGVAVGGERMMASCWQATISDYYFTTAHGIFIAALCGIGVQLIVYKGSSDTEDVLLTLSGVLAFIVAMVPNNRPVLLCGSHDLPVDGNVSYAITDNVWAVVIALGLARAVSWWLHRRTGTVRPKSVLGTVSLYVSRAIMGGGLIALVFFRPFFDAHAHKIAAALMFLAIIVTVAITAFLVSRQDDTKCPHRRLYHALYQVIAATMIATLIVVSVLHGVLRTWSHWFIILEIALVVEFGVYWVVQSIELWKTPNRVDLLPADDQSRLTQQRHIPNPAGLLPEVVEATETPIRDRLLVAL